MHVHNLEGGKVVWRWIEVICTKVLEYTSATASYMRDSGKREDVHIVRNESAGKVYNTCNDMHKQR